MSTRRTTRAFARSASCTAEARGYSEGSFRQLSIGILSWPSSGIRPNPTSAPPSPFSYPEAEPQAQNPEPGTPFALDRRTGLQALVAVLYRLSAHEFGHILGTFPLVDEADKRAVLREFRELAGAGSGG